VFRMFDVYPYPKKEIVRLVIADISGKAMGKADHERNNTQYLTDRQVPLVWYFTQSTVAGQGEIIRGILEDHTCHNPELKKVEILWIPKSGVPGLMNIRRDILEVSDTIQRCKEYGLKYSITVEIGLGNSWLPLGKAYHKDAVVVHSFNRTLEVAGFHWYQCRVIDIAGTLLHSHPLGTDPSEMDTLKIQGLENLYPLEKMYRFPEDGGHKLSFYSGRKIREIIRRTMTKYLLEPDWRESINTDRQFFQIIAPKTCHNRKWRTMPAPDRGLLPAHKVMKARAQIRLDYIAGESENRSLPPMLMTDYPWNLMAARSNIPGQKQIEDVQLPVSPGNRLLTDEVEREARPVRRSFSDRGGTPAKRGRPHFELREGESLQVLRVFKTPAKQSATPAMDRLGPRITNTADSGSRSRRSSRSTSRRRSTSRPTSRHSSRQSRRSKSRGSPRPKRRWGSAGSSWGSSSRQKYSWVQLLHMEAITKVFKIAEMNQGISVPSTMPLDKEEKPTRRRPAISREPSITVVSEDEDSPPMVTNRSLDNEVMESRR